MVYVLYGLLILTCIVLIASVLLQPGKADAGALFTSSVSSTAFGPRGTQTLLAKITIGAAALFMLLALTLSLPGITGSRSVVEDGDVESAQPQPAASVAAPAAPAAQPSAETAPAAASPSSEQSQPANSSNNNNAR